MVVLLRFCDLVLVCIYMYVCMMFWFLGKLYERYYLEMDFLSNNNGQNGAKRAIRAPTSVNLIKLCQEVCMHRQMPARYVWEGGCQQVLKLFFFEQCF